LPHAESVQPVKHIPALDGVRGFAAASVVLLHYGGGAHSNLLLVRAAGNVFLLGWAGVSLFFVLSGFLITGILLDGFEREDWWRTFYLRRSLRIFPLYYLALAIALVLDLTLDRNSGTLASLLVYALYLQDIPRLAFQLRDSPHLLLGHFWSLAVEEQFYLVWPFLLFAARSRGRRAAMGLCAGVWTLSLLFRIAIAAGPWSLTWATSFATGRAGELCAGALLAVAIRGSAAQRRRAIGQSSLLMIAGSALVAAALYHGVALNTPSMAIVGLSGFSLLFTGLIAMCLYPNPVQRFFTLAWLRYLGRISYGIYVYHLLFRPEYFWIAAHLVPHASRNMALCANAAVAVTGTLAIASLSFHTYERFFLRLKDRLARPRTLV
jgi:peptidoglycan/LPS O-acetylase OafA/YrhL